MSLTGCGSPLMSKSTRPFCTSYFPLSSSTILFIASMPCGVKERLDHHDDLHFGSFNNNLRHRSVI